MILNLSLSVELDIKPLVPTTSPIEGRWVESLLESDMTGFFREGKGGPKNTLDRMGPGAGLRAFQHHPVVESSSVMAITLYDTDSADHGGRGWRLSDTLHGYLRKFRMAAG